MQLTLTSEQNQLRDSVSRFMLERFPESDRRSRAQGVDGIDRRAWADMADLGWIGADLAEDVGGWGGGPVETMVILECSGQNLSPQPFVPLAVQALRLAVATRPGGEEVAGIVSGERLVTVALGDTSGTGRACLRKSGAGYILSGAKRLVPAGDAADSFIVTCDLDGATALALVQAGAPGVSLVSYRTLDDRRAADVTFTDVPIDPQALLATGTEARSALEGAERHAIAGLCAEATGIAQFLLDTTLDYVRTREQFGQPVGRFQAIQHRLADMFIAVEEARSLTIMATSRLAQPGDEPGQAHSIAAAKLGVQSRAMHVAREAIQLHGGVGMTEDLPLGAGFRRIKAMCLTYGDENTQLDRMAAGIRDRAYA